MGGVGKTTLAQLVYNDQRIKETDFSIKAWVCVSDEFDVLRLTKSILETISGSKYDNGELEMVHGRLKEELTGKRFFLVLDDVWNERHEDWKAVQTSLSFGAPGSRILVTTRSVKVASTMRSCKVHRPKQLEDDHCWQIFAKHAFQDDHLPLNAELKEIATKIVEKCKGLLLALKSIGCLLRSKLSIPEWENVLKSELWDLPMRGSGIIPALLLSYHHLPTHLKRCFSFCALFPKDYEFEKECLIQLWMAQNFLQAPQQSKSPEEVGEQYFDDLLSKSFFQPSGIFKTCFVMHDLVNDLANYVCGDICFRLGVGKARRVPKISRHFSIVSNSKEYFDVFESLHDAKRLRTFFPGTRRDSFVAITWECRISIHDLFSKFKFLHFLSLSHCSGLGELPMKLYKLTNLRCLEFRHTGVRRMPMHFGKLKNLQVLDVFCPGKSSEFGIGQLGGHNLHGELSIKELQDIEDPSDASAVDLINKTRLLKLKLEWNREHILHDNPMKEKEVLESLQPSKHLKYFSIESYGGTQFPSWLSNNSLSNVVSIWLENCKHCECLPSFGLLPSLKELRIRRFNEIVSVGAEFYGSSSSPFPSLETLSFYDMNEWEEWECNVTFPRLRFLEIERCPKLKGVSEVLLKVKEVYISGPSLEASSLETKGFLPLSRTSLRIWSCPDLNIPMRLCCDFLQKLDIHSSCDSLTTIPLDFFPKLCSLRLRNCPNLIMISQEHTHTHLKELSIEHCNLFESMPKRMHISLPSLTELKIRHCPKVEKFSEEGLPSNLKSVGLSSYKLMASLKGSLGVNTYLEALSIFGVDEVECFPEEGFLSLSLTSLTMNFFSNLKKVDYKGLCQLSSLKALNIYYCPELECLPEEGLPKSISTLTIIGCP